VTLSATFKHPQREQHGRELNRFYEERRERRAMFELAVIVAMVAEYTGDDRESTREDLKRELWKLADLPKTKRWKSKRTGKWRSRRLSIRDLSTSQMTRLIDVARKWAGEKLSLEIPGPDPGWRSPRRAA
jgi:hypothetical protein